MPHLDNRGHTFAQLPYLLIVTSAARMTTTSAFRMAIGTGFAAIVVARFFNSLGRVNNA